MIKADEQNRVVVVGGGLGGLAAACTLAARGYAVTLCEKNAWVGGKAISDGTATSATASN